MTRIHCSKGIKHYLIIYSYTEHKKHKKQYTYWNILEGGATSKERQPINVGKNTLNFPQSIE